VRGFGTNPGNLRMLVAVPADLAAGSALVVVAHGCMQDAQDIADSSGWADLALAHGFAAVFPQTSKHNDPFAGCFRTWLPEHQQRGAGEPLSVMQMIEWMSDHHAIDRRKVFITGLSSGGHLTNVMLATYPDVFAAGAPQSSFPYKCATSFEEVAPCCFARKPHSRAEWGELARSGYPGYTGPRPRVSIWHGGADPLLLVGNLGLQAQQWGDVLALAVEPDESTTRERLSHSLWRDSSGTEVLETNVIDGMGHAVAVDVRVEPPSCGRPGPYADDVDMCAAEQIARWFGIVP
jgi:poly(hydroxyalkanoate) depolymerase family esterase